jgi:hypothetical protein
MDLARAIGNPDLGQNKAACNSQTAIDSIRNRILNFELIAESCS